MQKKRQQNLLADWSNFKSTSEAVDLLNKEGQNKSEKDRRHRGSEGRDSRRKTLLVQEEFLDLKNRLIDFSAQSKKKLSAVKSR